MMKYLYTFKYGDEGYDDLMQDVLVTLVQRKTSDVYVSDNYKED